jgi:hypothetical protein
LISGVLPVIVVLFKDIFDVFFAYIFCNKVRKTKQKQQEERHRSIFDNQVII